MPKRGPRLKVQGAREACCSVAVKGAKKEKVKKKGPCDKNFITMSHEL
jgi:hypothetical protein